MLYWLYRHLDINILQYITVRAGFAFFIAFLLTLFLMPRFIRWARAKKANQPISAYAPKGHQSKTNTPTMGGAVFLASALAATLLSIKLNNLYVVLGIGVLLLFGAIGFQDDYAKIMQQKNKGLGARSKLLMQIGFAGLVALGLYLGSHTSDLYVPFYKYPLFDMGFGALFFWIFIMVGSSNAVNLTDGLDGLATVPSIFALGTLSAIAYFTGHAMLSSYLLIPKIIAVGEVAIIAAAMAGALIGFLWYNCHPAEIFMGDTGSLSTGAFIGYMGIITKSEILLILIGFIFVIETVSVIIQIASYKIRQKRVFLMAPIHHHFEEKNWAENKIIVRFWIIALMSNLIALITLKIR